MFNLNQIEFILNELNWIYISFIQLNLNLLFGIELKPIVFLTTTLLYCYAAVASILHNFFIKLSSKFNLDLFNLILINLIY